ncbi:MAG: hypothetical protein EYC62_06500 [Alphaproteobacteria bacterium]|nr:MAG: hypothetical protein EYC62_06500 [Alphaproteobacteria bacterium]
MLTPSLACAMPMCVDKPKQEAAAKPPCDGHGMQMQHQNADGKPATAGLMKDCLGVDFQLADAGPVLKKPDLQKDFSFSLASALIVADSIVLDGTKGNRGPPDWPGLFNATSPSIILSTQRRLI